MSFDVMVPSYLTSPRNAALAVFAISLATILGAWGFELIGGYWPCPLCLKQRWAYYAVVPISLALIVIARPDRHFATRAGLLLCGLIMLAGAALGVYHSGVEWKLWAGPQTCAGGAGLSGGLPDLGNIQVVACDEAQWRFVGLSFAGFNVVVSLIVAYAAFCGVRGDQGSSSVSQ